MYKPTHNCPKLLSQQSCAIVFHGPNFLTFPPLLFKKEVPVTSAISVEIGKPLLAKKTAVVKVSNINSPVLAPISI